MSFDQTVETCVHVLHDDVQNAFSIFHFEEVIFHFNDIWMVQLRNNGELSIFIFDILNYLLQGVLFLRLLMGGLNDDIKYEIDSSKSACSDQLFLDVTVLLNEAKVTSPTILLGRFFIRFNLSFSIGKYDRSKINRNFYNLKLQNEKNKYNQLHISIKQRHLSLLLRISPKK